MQASHIFTLIFVSMVTNPIQKNGNMFHNQTSCVWAKLSIWFVACHSVQCSDQIRSQIHLVSPPAFTLQQAGVQIRNELIHVEDFAEDCVSVWNLQHNMSTLNLKKYGFFYNVQSWAMMNSVTLLVT